MEEPRRRRTAGSVSPKWTFDDFKDRVKFQIGDEAYTIESIGEIDVYAPRKIFIKKHIVVGLSRATLNADDPKTIKLTYTTGKNLSSPFFWDSNSYKTKEEALAALKIKLEDYKKYYLERYDELYKDLETKYQSWLAYIHEEEQHETN
jgi:hypothetical protein